MLQKKATGNAVDTYESLIAKEKELILKIGEAKLKIEAEEKLARGR